MSSVTGRRTVLFFGALLLVVYLLLAYVFYTSVTRHVTGANDFYSRWMGARALFMDGANPYSDAVTRDIQIGMYGRLARPDEDQVAFAYPLPAAFLAVPLIGLPYPLAQALWMAGLAIGVCLGVVVLVLQTRPMLSPALLATVVLGAMVSYPSVRAIFNGQYAIVSFLFMALAFWAISRRWDIAAGALLALATVKPQPVILLVPVAVLWATRHRRWHVVASAAGVFGALVVAGLFLLPSWPLDFLRAMGAYAAYISVGPPGQLLVEYLTPAPWSLPLALVAGVAVLLWVLVEICKSLDGTWDEFHSVLGLAAVATTLMAGRIGSSDEVLLFIPWVFWLDRWVRSGARWQSALVAVALVVVPWIAFLTTLRGDAENPMVAVILPVISLALSFWLALVPERPRAGAVL